MFLDPNGQKIRDSIHASHTAAFTFAYRLVDFANESLQSASVTSGDLQQILLAPLAIRSTTTFQATVLMLERGLASEAKILARSLLEGLFRAVAIAKSRSYAEVYVQEDQFFRKKLINKSKLLSPHLRKKFEGDGTAALATEINAYIGASKISERTTQWWATAAGLSDFYNTAYALFSNSVHVSSRTLESHLKLNDNEEITSLHISPSTEDLGAVMISACESLLLTLESASSIMHPATATTVAALKTELVRLNEVI